MKKALWMLLLYLISGVAFCAMQTSSAFYPLPTQSQGKVIAAKNLFLAEKGGIWLQDVRNQILFFDGLNILPESGSAIDYDTANIAYLDNAFWTFFQNEVYRSVPNQTRELMFSLTPGAEIVNIGASRKYIWVADASNFYTYHIESGEFNQYSLMEMYQFNPSVKISINDAEFVFSKWVIATNAGVYLSSGEQFDHVSSSGSYYIEEIYFSERRREVIVGTLSGALIFGIEEPNKQVKRIAEDHVLSITETAHEYWVGTEKGLFVYSHTTGETWRVGSNQYGLGSSSGNKIYSLLNDDAGGIWIATDRGVRYFAQYSELFQRTFYSEESNLFLQALKSAAVSKSTRDLLVKSHLGLTRLSKTNPLPQRILKEQVEDLAEYQGVLYVATKHGVLTLDALTGEIIENNLPQTITSSSTEFIDVSQEEHLWGASGQQLWSFDFEHREFVQYGSDWMIDNFLPAKLTQLQPLSSNNVMLGTEHGVYLLKQGQVNFISSSSLYGEVIDIQEIAPDLVWVAARYGLYQVNLSHNTIEPVDMVDSHVTPLCLLKNSDGIWLTSSAGLSQFNREGRLLTHYGEPFGLRNNELSSSICSLDPQDEKSLIIGSGRGVIQVQTQQLVVSPLPKVQLILSQVKLNQDLYSLGNSVKVPLVAGYSDSITFHFGMLPSIPNLEIEYRITTSEAWQRLEGSTLTLDHLLPGDYQLQVRALRSEHDRSKHILYHFTVSEPWFMTSWSIFLMVIAAGLVIMAGVYWRSHLITKSNKQLKAQVLLKTDQLRHQGRTLLANNHQLRKQLQVRRLIFAQSIEGVRAQLEQNVQAQNLSARTVMNQFSTELEQLLNVNSTDDASIATYNLAAIVESAIGGWQEEFSKAGLTIDYSPLDSTPIYMRYFNLDELLTLLFDSTVKRSYRNQVVQIKVYLNGDRLTLSMLDEGEYLENSSTTSSTLNTLAELVEQSGGWLRTHSSQERNLVEVEWLTANLENEEAESTLSVDKDEERSKDVWLEKLLDLVNCNYNDPDFSTSTAAKKLYVSERSLQRRFKKSMDKTFVEYLSEVRLDQACQQLLAGEKVSEVAFHCGFNDPSYFSQRFKHRFGMSPTQFVEEHRGY